MALTSTARPGAISAPQKISVMLSVNGVETQLKVAVWTTLLDALRDHLDLAQRRAAITASAALAQFWSTAAASIPV